MPSSPRRLIVILLLAGLLAGCSSGPRLYDERTVEPYASHLRSGAALCPQSVHVRAEDPGACPLWMHLDAVRSPASKPDDPLLVLLPGVLSDRLSWRFLWPVLAERYDVLLVDLPGQGLSDKPDWCIAPDAYSPAWLGRHALRAVRCWQRRRDDHRRLVLVGHSLGSTALLRALADPASSSQMSDLVARVDRLVCIAVADLGMTEVSEVFEDLEGLSDFEAAAGSALGILGRRVREGIPESVAQPERAFCAEADRLTAIIARPETRKACQAMLRRFRPLDRCRRPVWSRIRALEAEYGNVQQPVLVLWGAQDQTLDPRTCGRVAAQLPDGRCEHVADSRHSPHQEQPRYVADRIFRFIETGE